MEKVKRTHKIIGFPDRKARRKILLEHEDRRVRAVATMRITCGWMFIAGLILFIFSNYALFKPTSIRNIAELAVSGVKNYEGTISTIKYTNEVFEDGEIFNGGLAYVDSDSLFLAKPGSPSYTQYTLGYSSPVVETAGNYVLAYDRGGVKVMLAGASKELCEFMAGSPIINGSIIENGHFILVTAEQGYRTAATLYDSHGTEILKYASSDYYFISSGLTPNGKTMAVLGFKQDGTALISRAVFLSAADGSLISECDIPDSLVMELCPVSDDTVAALCDDGLYLISVKGRPEHILEFSSNDLLAFAANGESVGLAVRSYSGNARSDLYALRSNCKLKGPYESDKEPTAVAVSDSGMAVLSASGVCIYDDSFQPLWQNPDAVGARRILLADDSSVFALYAKHATRLSSRSSKSEVFAKKKNKIINRTDDNIEDESDPGETTPSVPAPSETNTVNAPVAQTVPPEGNGGEVNKDDGNGANG